MNPQRFIAEIEARPRGSIAIRVPFDPSTVWGQKDRHYVTGSLEHRMLRGVLDTTGPGPYFLQLGPSWCRDRRWLAGERVAVELEPEGPQIASMAPDLAAALIAEPAARRFFESLATFYRKGYVNWIEQAKRTETRTRRIDEAVAALKDGRDSR